MFELESVRIQQALKNADECFFCTTCTDRSPDFSNSFFGSDNGATLNGPTDSRPYDTSPCNSPCAELLM